MSGGRARSSSQAWEAIQCQLLSRRVNERMREILLVADDVACWFGCECGDVFCAEIVELTAARYDSVRADSARFFVLPGHVDRMSETVVERGDGYLVVEK